VAPIAGAFLASQQHRTPKCSTLHQVSGGSWIAPWRYSGASISIRRQRAYRRLVIMPAALWVWTRQYSRRTHADGWWLKYLGTIPALHTGTLGTPHGRGAPLWPSACPDNHGGELRARRERPSPKQRRPSRQVCMRAPGAVRCSTAMARSRRTGDAVRWR
jgi:hypothetical protein